MLFEDSHPLNKRRGVVNRCKIPYPRWKEVVPPTRWMLCLVGFVPKRWCRVFLHVLNSRREKETMFIWSRRHTTHYTDTTKKDTNQIKKKLKTNINVWCDPRLHQIGPVQHNTRQLCAVVLQLNPWRNSCILLYVWWSELIKLLCTAIIQINKVK